MLFPKEWEEKVASLKETLERQGKRGTRGKYRELLAGKGASFYPLRMLSAAEVQVLAKGRPLVGVDGSVNTYGGYPRVIAFLQAAAKVTFSREGKKKVTAARVLSPLFPEGRAEMESLLAQGLGGEEAFFRLQGQFLASLELEVATQALEVFRPFLLLFDGGFTRLASHASVLWETYQEKAFTQGVFTVGVIEEVASNSLVSLLGLGEDVPAGDRPLLFGLLDPGECLFLPRPAKGRWLTAFARLSVHPQAIGFDFFSTQRKEILEIFNYLYTITPRQGRGFPLWLDLVDAEVRLTQADVSFLMEALGIDLKERFFTPLRSFRFY